MEEVHMVVRIARRYHHHRLNFCIITFYDPQRAAIIKALESADMPSEIVYNVDSFQGMVPLALTQFADPNSSLFRE
jgi:hypothetical protein